MNILIAGAKTIGDIQQEFQEGYPFLKIEFFKVGNNTVKSSNSRIPDNNLFGTFKTNIHSENLTITPNMTVAELERTIRSHYALSIRILRKSGRAWLETTLTDSWTLQEQNEQGRALSG